MASKRTALLLGTLVLLVSCSQILVASRRGRRAEGTPEESPTAERAANPAPPKAPQAPRCELLEAQSKSDSDAVSWALRAAAALDAGKEHSPEGFRAVEPGVSTAACAKRPIGQQRRRRGAPVRPPRPESIGFVDEGKAPLRWTDGLERLDLTASGRAGSCETAARPAAVDRRRARAPSRPHAPGSSGQASSCSTRATPRCSTPARTAAHSRRHARVRTVRAARARLDRQGTSPPQRACEQDTTSTRTFDRYRCSGSTLHRRLASLLHGRQGPPERPRRTLWRRRATPPSPILGQQLGSRSESWRSTSVTASRAGLPIDGAAYGWAQPLVTARELGDLAIGLNQAEMTPLHGAVIARSWVDGVLRPPTLQLTADGPLGNSPRRAALSDPVRFGTPRRVLEEDWLPLVHRSLLEVTSRRGTASLVSDAYSGGAASGLAKGRRNPRSRRFAECIRCGQRTVFRGKRLQVSSHRPGQVCVRAGRQRPPGRSLLEKRATQTVPEPFSKDR